MIDSAKILKGYIIATAFYIPIFVISIQRFNIPILSNSDDMLGLISF